MTETLPIVNEEDVVIGQKDRGTLNKNDIYRVAALWIENSSGQVLLARRSLKKKKDPGLWGPAVVGTVSFGETYKKNIIREAAEELGLKKIKPKKLFKARVKNPYNHFTQWFKIVLDESLDYFKIQKEEVEEIKFIDKQKLFEMVKQDNQELIPSFKFYINNYLK